MKTIPPSLIPLRWLLAGLVGLTLQSCKTPFIGKATPATPFVVTFDFQEPVQTTAAEKERFVKALELAVPEMSKVLVDGHQVWPPKLATLTTERVVSAGERTGDETKTVKTKGQPAFVHRAKDTKAYSRNTKSVVHGGGGSNTKLVSQFPEAFVARAKSTQCIAFKSDADMREFLRILGGGRK